MSNYRTKKISHFWEILSDLLKLIINNWDQQLLTRIKSFNLLFYIFGNIRNFFFLCFNNLINHMLNNRFWNLKNFFKHQMWSKNHQSYESSNYNPIYPSENSFSPLTSFPFDQNRVNLVNFFLWRHIDFINRLSNQELMEWWRSQVA